MDYTVGYYLKRAQHALRLKMDQELQRVGLTTAQYAALNALEAEPGLSNAALARRCFVTPQTMNMIVVQLESNGLIERRSHPEHGRVLQTVLTAIGQRQVQQAHQIVAQVEAQMVRLLMQDQQQQLVQWLKQCSESLEAHKDRAP